MGKTRFLQALDMARERERDADSNMRFRDLVQLYFEKPFRIRNNTIAAKKELVETMLLPFWGEKRLCDITPVDVLRWQREITRQIDPRTERPFPQKHFTAAHNQLIELFDYAVRFCGLSKNPAKSVRPMQSKKVNEAASQPNPEYQGFEKYITDEQMAHCCRELLYWSGIQEGELLALTLKNIDLEEKTITVTKTLQSIPGGEYLASPKRLGSRHKIKIPDFLCEELRDYIQARGELKRGDRLFPIAEKLSPAQDAA